MRVGKPVATEVDTTSPLKKATVLAGTEVVRGDSAHQGAGPRQDAADGAALGYPVGLIDEVTCAETAGLLRSAQGL